MKIWVDDVRPAPKGYVWCHSVLQTIRFIEMVERVKSVGESKSHNADDIVKWKIELIDIDHDAGDFAELGGDYIKILDWLEETGRRYPIHIHSMNPVGIENMRRIIRKNGWEEV